VRTIEPGEARDPAYERQYAAYQRLARELAT
jgi:hypothetical protein